MNNQEEQELLGDFFGAYFHQDWQDEAESPEEIIKNYASEAGIEKDDLLKLSNALQSFLNKHKDNEIEDWLYNRWGCEYVPREDGISEAAWLRNVAAQLFALAEQE